MSNVVFGEESNQGMFGPACDQSELMLTTHRDKGYDNKFAINIDMNGI